MFLRGRLTKRNFPLISNSFLASHNLCKAKQKFEYTEGIIRHYFEILYIVLLIISFWLVV